MVREEYVFFLGGRDAEMLAIEGLLQKHNACYFNLRPPWGARASLYQNELAQLKPGQIPVLIELFPDIKIPPNAKTVDHHNERSGKDTKTSLEQIAEMFNEKLTREQQLIAANDRGYIDGMKAIGATNEEIKRIRELDRREQGITDEDMRLAAESIENNSEVFCGRYCWVHSKTNRSAAVTDQLYGLFHNLIVTTPDRTFNFSGEGKIVQKLVEHFTKEKVKNPALVFWYGGALPDYGFFGAKYEMSKEKFSKIIEGNIMDDSKVFSQHIFMYPFRMSKRKTEQTKKDCLDTVCFLEEVKGYMKANSQWSLKEYIERAKFAGANDDDVKYYNELSYFHSFTSDALFNTKNIKGSEKVSDYYQYSLPDKSSFICAVRINNDVFPYKLNIDTVGLHVFNTGIGILTITLYNHTYDQLDDILRINDYGRRIYPQFFGTGDYMLSAPKGSFLPESIKLELDETIEEDFSNPGFLTGEVLRGRHIEHFLEPLTAVYDCFTIIDDRMFTVCWYGNSSFINILKAREIDKYNYENNKDWYRYCFLDGGEPLVDSIEMRSELIKRVTYPRFVSRGTLYGITRYSFMCLTDSEWFGTTIVRQHIQSMYYQMAVLLLAQRASIISFNERIREVVKKLGEDDTQDENSLLQDILRFSNSIWFDEVSPQEQGIELYKLAQDNMEIRYQLESLRARIDELDDYMEVRNTEKTNKTMLNLTLLGVVFLPLTLWAALMQAFLGLNFLGTFASQAAKYKTLTVTLCFTIIYTLLLHFTIIPRNKNKHNNGISLKDIYNPWRAALIGEKNSLWPDIISFFIWLLLAGIVIFINYKG